MSNVNNMIKYEVKCAVTTLLEKSKDFNGMGTDPYTRGVQAKERLCLLLGVACGFRQLDENAIGLIYNAGGASEIDELLSGEAIKALISDVGEMVSLPSARIYTVAKNVFASRIDNILYPSSVFDNLNLRAYCENELAGSSSYIYANLDYTIEIVNKFIAAYYNSKTE